MGKHKTCLMSKIKYTITIAITDTRSETIEKRPECRTEN